MTSERPSANGDTAQALWRAADAAFERLLAHPVEAWDALVAAEPDAVRPFLRRMVAAYEATGPLDRRPDLAAEAPREIGPWHLGAEIGRGGMAIVYRAEREIGGTCQVAALKLLTTGALAADGRRHFHREHELLARLQHPHIVPLLDAGVLADGTPYLAMPLVDGVRIDAWCRARALPPRRIVVLFLQVCEAVAHAHRHLVVHRDLKPGNILVDADGQVRLLDFGIARLLDEAGGEATATQWRALTPQYAAPEQFEGRDSGTAVDVFGLGAVLHQLFTGAPPQRSGKGAAGEATLASRAVAAGAEGRLRARQLRGDLDAILARALARDPAQRYPDAAALAADLRRWLDGRPVVAARAGRAYRVRKFVARNRGGVAAGLLLALAIGAGMVGTLWQGWRAGQAAQQARQEAGRATAVRDFLSSLFEAANPEREGGAITDVRELLAQARGRLADPGLAPVLRADLEGEIGMIYMALGDIAQGRALVQASLAHWGAMPGQQREVARTQLRLSRLEYRAGRYREALAAAEAALGLAEALDPPDPPLLVSALANAGTSETAMKTVPSPTAIARLERALALARELRPADPDAVRSRLHSLGQAYRQADRMAEAETYLEQSVAMAERGGKADSAEVLATYWELSMVLMERNKVGRARLFADRALALARRTYPPGHYRLAAALEQHAGKLMQVGEKPEAVRELTEAVAILRRQTGMGSSRLSGALFNLAVVQHEVGAADDAVANLAESQALDERELGPNHGYVLSGLTWRARILADQGGTRMGEADALVDEAEARLSTLDPGARWSIHVETAAVRVADHRNLQGRHAEALRWVELAIDRHHARGDGSNPTLAWAELVHAAALSGGGAPPDRVRTALQRTLEVAGECADELVIDLSRSYLEVAEIALDRGWRDLARQAWTTFERRRGDQAIPALWHARHQAMAARMTGTP